MATFRRNRSACMFLATLAAAAAASGAQTTAHGSAAAALAPGAQLHCALGLAEEARIM